MQEKLTVYIAGKVTGVDRYAVEQKFNDAHECHEALGREVINPILIVPPHADHAEAMRILVPLITKAHIMYLLFDWQTSMGARLEVLIAHACGVKLVLQDQRQARDLNNYLNVYTWKR